MYIHYHRATHASVAHPSHQDPSLSSRPMTSPQRPLISPSHLGPPAHLSLSQPLHFPDAPTHQSPRAPPFSTLHSPRGTGPSPNDFTNDLRLPLDPVLHWFNHQEQRGAELQNDIILGIQRPKPRRSFLTSQKPQFP
ncbi:hypothetical protein P152DRAFT_195998 [Eremomyces bilateralis CBS 781.70]|uniref:Uncharacterized protein n=1 Tax=Eremomyces bilateralis CBS 781.70 TaxID=1392243 RepID=A0A6G1GD18_9PEZI|nr:uncharacterized protein P152DRAFT_195998 [Eremomyces bilateralis CBS 781.70]KAF1815759.1 hypothetical protein P152DRAFT_195998 [Eremomyces bilateralis CBS 781.70]